MKTKPFIVAVASLKGGVGKTSLAVNVANTLAARGERVALVDCDPQSSATDFYLRDLPTADIMAANVRHVLVETLEPEQAIRVTSGGPAVLPATPLLHTVGLEMSGDPGGLVRFGRGLESLPYDRIIIDTPPSLSYEFRAALYAARLVLVPICADRWALQGFGLLKAEIAKVAKATGGQGPKLLAVPSMVSNKEDEELREDDLPFTRATIFRRAAVRTALIRGVVLKLNSKSGMEFDKLVKEVFSNGKK